MPDKDNLILTAVGPDQVGLVEKISQFIAQHGCNIEDSKMAVFCGEFALILLISGDAGNLLKVANAYNELGILTGLNISVRKPAAKRVPAQSLPYRITASCLDHPGVVHRLSGLLEPAEHQYRVDGNQDLSGARQRHAHLSDGGVTVRATGAEH